MKSPSCVGAYINSRCALALSIGLLLEGILVGFTPAQTVADVTVHLTLKGVDGTRLVPSASEPVVVWLSLLNADGSIDLSTQPGLGRSFQMVQKDKLFQPHLLVVPSGSLVSFPNRDPFFHNVFSLFNGRRFDLGLYETGASHSVPFKREGVSYIFCNIHSDMGAVIVSVATPYFAIATQASVQLHRVPPGEYLLKTWAEDASMVSLEKASRRVRVGESSTDAGSLEITLQPRERHTDKFGNSYQQHPEGSLY